MTLSDFVYRQYNDLLDAGWTLSEIDRCDLPGLWTVRAWRAQQKAKPKRVFIDAVWPSGTQGGGGISLI